MSTPPAIISAAVTAGVIVVAASRQPQLLLLPKYKLGYVPMRLWWQWMAIWLLSKSKPPPDRFQGLAGTRRDKQLNSVFKSFQ
jgi:hypothetical protein